MVKHVFYDLNGVRVFKPKKFNNLLGLRKQYKDFQDGVDKPTVMKLTTKQNKKYRSFLLSFQKRLNKPL